MRKIRTVLMLMAILTTQQVLADDMSDMQPNYKPCMTIAKACHSAGFVRGETGNKRIWQDCMKPIILGQTVSGVTVDPAMVKACRTHKIKEMQTELNDLQKVN